MFLERAYDKEFTSTRSDADLAWNIHTVSNKVAQGSIDRFLDLETLMSQCNERTATIQGIGFIATYTPPSLQAKSRGYALTLLPNINDEAVVTGHNMHLFLIDTSKLVTTSRQSFRTKYYEGADSQKDTLEKIESQIPLTAKFAVLAMLIKLDKDKQLTEPLDGPTFFGMSQDSKELDISQDELLRTIEPFDMTELAQTESYVRWVSGAVDSSVIESEKPTALSKILSVDGSEYAVITEVDHRAGTLYAHDPKLVKRQYGDWEKVSDPEEMALSIHVISKGTEVSTKHAMGIVKEIKDKEELVDDPLASTARDAL